MKTFLLICASREQDKVYMVQTLNLTLVRCSYFGYTATVHGSVGPAAFYCSNSNKQKKTFHIKILNKNTCSLHFNYTILKSKYDWCLPFNFRRRPKWTKFLFNTSKHLCLSLHLPTRFYNKVNVLRCHVNPKLINHTHFTETICNQMASSGAVQISSVI